MFCLPRIPKTPNHTSIQYSAPSPEPVQLSLGGCSPLEKPSLGQEEAGESASGREAKKGESQEGSSTPGFTAHRPQPLLSWSRASEPRASSASLKCRKKTPICLLLAPRGQAAEVCSPEEINQPGSKGTREEREITQLTELSLKNLAHFTEEETEVQRRLVISPWSHCQEVAESRFEPQFCWLQSPRAAHSESASALSAPGGLVLGQGEAVGAVSELQGPGTPHNSPTHCIDVQTKTQSWQVPIRNLGIRDSEMALGGGSRGGRFQASRRVGEK